eukprot:1107787-Prymnesium_polylepis.1
MGIKYSVHTVEVLWNADSIRALNAGGASWYCPGSSHRAVSRNAVARASTLAFVSTPNTASHVLSAGST